MLRLLLISSLLISTVFGQAKKDLPEAEHVYIRNFEGLNTIVGDFSIKPNECRVAHNIDWSRNLGSITKRYGYDSISSRTGIDSIIALYPYYTKNGQKRLIFVTKDQGVGTGTIWATKDGSVDLSTADTIATGFSIVKKPSLATYNDILYVANGTGKGVQWDGKFTRRFPLQAPGEPLVTVLKDSCGLKGMVRYAFKVIRKKNSGSKVDTSLYLSYISQPVQLNYNRVRLSNFMWPQPTKFVDVVDSAKIYIFRSRTTIPFDITTNDTCFYIDSVMDGSGNKFAGKSVIDSGQSLSVMGGDPMVEQKRAGYDSTQSVTLRYGSPTFASLTRSAYDTASAKTSKGGVFYGIPTQKDTLGMAYVVTYIDTITGAESDSGRSLFVFNDSTGAHHLSRTITINIPNSPSGTSSIAMNVYRALIQQITYDTTHIGEWIKSGTTSGGLTKIGRAKPNQYLVVDTIVTGDYFKVKLLPPGTSSFTDSVRWDSSSTQTRFTRKTPPPFFTKIVSYDNRIFGTQGSRLYFSRLDSGYNFNAFDFTDLNSGDGDVITTIYPSRTALRVGKNRSMYNVYQDADGLWTKDEISQNYGVIAPYSYAPGFLGHYYLTDQGVVRENEGMYQSRTQAYGLVSAKLDNFNKIPAATKRQGVGTYYKQKYLLSYPSLDTTYVYDEKADAWSTWSLAFTDACQFGVNSTSDFIPGDTLYFIKKAGKSLYRYGTSENDGASASSQMTIVYRSGTFLQELEGLKSISGVTMWVKSDLNTFLSGHIYNEEDSNIFDVVLTSDARQRHQDRAVPVQDPSAFFKLGFEYTGHWQTNPFVIDGFDIEYLKQGAHEVE